MKKGGICILILLLMSFSVLAEEGYDKWMMPQDKGAALKNAISPTDLVNLKTGEFAIRYPFPPYQGRGFSYTPVLSFNPSYTKVKSNAVQTYFGEWPQVITDDGRPAYSAYGFGWHLSPFGYITSEKKYENSQFSYEYRIVLPDGGSERIIPKGTEYVAGNDLSVPDWNTDGDFPGKTVYIQEFRMRSNPFSLIVKRYRTLIATDVPGSLEPVYDHYRWYAQSTGNDKYYFDHAVYHRVPVVKSATIFAFDTPKSITLYFKEYDRWDLGSLVPHGIPENTVRFQYSDAGDYRDTQTGYVDAVREQFSDILAACKQNTGQDCGTAIHWFFGEENLSKIPWDVLGKTDYVSNTRPEWIYQNSLGTQRLGIHFFGYNRQDKIFAADLTAQALQTYCARDNLCSDPNHGYHMDETGPFLLMLGYPDNPWGAYKKLDSLRPFTTYTIKGEFDVQGPVGNGCTLGDVEFTQSSNQDDTPGHGYYALVKVGSFAVDGTHIFNPEAAFTHSTFIDPGRAVWFATDNWNPHPNNCWADSGNCHGPKAGILGNLDSYMVNCWTLLENGNYYTVPFEETFTTAAETSRVVYVSAYNPNSNSVTLKLRSFDVHIKPAQHLLTGIDYTGQNSNDITQAFNLYYDSDPDGDGQPNLRSIQQVGYLVGENGQDSLPPTNFTYDSTGKVMTRIDLPTGGSVQLESYDVSEKTWTKDDPWLPYYVGPFYDEIPFLPKTYVKEQLRVDSIRTVDNYFWNVVTGYTYTDWVWNDLDEAYYATFVDVTNPLGDKTHSLFSTDHPADYPLFGTLVWTITWDHALGASLLNSHYYYDVYDYQANPHIFHVRATAEEMMRFGEQGEYVTTRTDYQSFDPLFCDLPKEIISNGFTDENGDEFKTVSTYINDDPFLCLLQQSSKKLLDNTELTRSTNEYYGAGDGNKRGFLKKKTSLNLVKPSENQWTTLDYDSYGNIVSMQDSKGATTTIAYDPDYHILPIRHTNPLSQQEMMFYDYFHRAANATGINAGKSFVQYDDLNRICKFQLPGGTPPSTIRQVPGSAEDICQTQGVHKPDLREGMTAPPPLPCTPGDHDCGSSEWCCDDNDDYQGTCVPRSQSCPSSATCTPACGEGQSCCRYANHDRCIDSSLDCPPY